MSVEDEVRAEFMRYEAALATNDVDALIAFFRQDETAIRMMTEGGLYGISEIAAFRKGRDTADMARELTRVEIRALAPDIAVACAEYRRTGSGRRGSQSQVWQRGTDARWRIVAAHVSLGG